MNRKIKRLVRGRKAVDGAGVNLVRVLGGETTKDFDPFLMLDSFDSCNPDDYTAGFPLHPHRGIETITWLASGRIAHEDTLGNSGEIVDGGVQWMTAGSGILHQEMPTASPRMLGLQLWLNLPRAEKMTEPKYFDIRDADIPVVRKDGLRARVISGSFEGVSGSTPHHLQASLIDVSLDAGRAIDMPTDPLQTVFVFLLEGDAQIDEQLVPEKTAVLFGSGERIAVQATETPLRFLFVQGPPLGEPIAWGGPIVMNTDEELRQAFADLRAKTFIKQKPTV